MEIRQWELKNGIRVLHAHVPYTEVVHCGYVIDVGSRDDGALPGIAHFVEHMIFKGTNRRKTFHILNYLEAVGGDVNAYTTKEKTAVYASLPARHAAKAVELLTEIVFSSVFPEKEIEKERQVISEEIDSYRDAPDEAIFEDFDQMIFPGHPLGLPILGTTDALGNISREALLNHTSARFTADATVLVLAGNITRPQVDKLLARYVSPLMPPIGRVARTAPPQTAPIHQKVEIPGSQAHEIIGGRALPLGHDLYHAFWLVNNLLGGPAMNSRLNLNIRERHGLTYSISSFFSPHTDSGQWGVYYACDPSSLRRVHSLVTRELTALTDAPLGSLALNRIKQQSIGQLILNNESLLSVILQQANDLLDFGQIEPLSHILTKIENLTAAELHEVAKLSFAPDAISKITYLPAKE